MTADNHPLRWRTLGLLAVAELLGMSLWFAASAVSGQLGMNGHWLRGSGMAHHDRAARLRGGHRALGDAQPRRHHSIEKTFRCVCIRWRHRQRCHTRRTDEYAAALALRFLTGFFLAGVYPPAMKMIATWFRAQRGLAIGTIVGALTVGKATPYLVHAIPDAGVRAVDPHRVGGGGSRAILVLARIP